MLLPKLRQCAIFLSLRFSIAAFLFLSNYLLALAEEQKAEQAINCQTLGYGTDKQHDVSAPGKNQALTKIVRFGGVKIVAERQLLRAYTGSGESDDVVSVKQKDLGEIRGIFINKEGVMAIGDQTNYFVKIKTVLGKARFYGREELPSLYRKPCGVIEILFGACQISDTFFSSELGVAFISGFDKKGLEHSYAFSPGMPMKELGISGKDLFYYVSDVVGSGSALFKMSTGRYYLFDGERFRQCNM